MKLHVKSWGSSAGAKGVTMRRFSLIMAVLCVVVALVTLMLLRNRTAIPAPGAGVPVYLEVGESIVTPAPPSAPAEYPR